MAQQSKVAKQPSQRFLGWSIALIVALLIAHWNDLNYLGALWSSAEYSHGYLVPFFALLVLGHRRLTGQWNPLGATAANSGASSEASTAVGAGFDVHSKLDLAGAVFLAVSGVLLALGNWVLQPGVVESNVLLAGICTGVAGGMLLARPDFELPQVVTGRWLGVGLVAVSSAVRLWSTWHSAMWPSNYGFVLSIAGVFLIVYGWQGLQWSWAAVAILVLLLPLPETARNASMVPLQNFATTASQYLLETVGLPITREGNQLLIGAATTPMNVAEQCSGLRMLTIFFALCAMIAVFMERPVWERVAVVLSAAPIALGVNVLRITATGIMKHLAESEFSFLGISVSQNFADHFFHDWAGYFMMPLALLLLYVESWILANVFIDMDDVELTATDFVAPRREREREPVSARG